MDRLKRCQMKKLIFKEPLFLPREIQSMILSFLRESRKFYVQDLGSVHGTFIKAQRAQTQFIRKGQTYLIGNDVYINIEELCNPRPNMVSNENQIRQLEDFYSYLA